jgi:hypothetical protein
MAVVADVEYVKKVDGDIFHVVLAVEHRTKTGSDQDYRESFQKFKRGNAPFGHFYDRRTRRLGYRLHKYAYVQMQIATDESAARKSPAKICELLCIVERPAAIQTNSRS